MSRPTNFLEADSSLIENNLLIVKNEAEEELNQYFAGVQAGGESRKESLAPPRDYKVVQPKPGVCIKSFKTNTNEKFFINVCQTDEIPAPEDITEEQLADILQSEAPSSFRIPMSISDPRVTKDKSNNSVDVCDIAINPKFFVKVQKSMLFKDFFLALIAEALNDKYNVQIKIEKSIILQNRKVIGTLVQHRVRNNDVKTVIKSYQQPTEADKLKLAEMERAATSGEEIGSKRSPLVQEIDTSEVDALKRKTVELKENAGKIKQSIALAGSTVPEYKLRAKLCKEEVEELLAEFYLPKCISSQEITLDVGEDRILLESMKHGYMFDKFVNYRLNQERVRAIFDKTNKMLQVRIPVYPVQ
ncbi:PREDICTED: PIH1 domain-containing protein 1 isoform X1 [Rhagoletis zephyria]|uniref:PIH1 domain-containing protein 1 isoform X1 n=1 Tax=Rhagoletis zephyria TaxID=28612 RepID=UPI0008112C6C|nr:PREDICTED: PIH1 domain-containing protein 1 isoform X1 [Rhagoletis zephyria]